MTALRTAGGDTIAAGSASAPDDADAAALDAGTVAGCEKRVPDTVAVAWFSDVFT